MTKVTMEMSQNGILGIKCSVTENKNTCNRTSKWDMTNEITSGLEGIAIEISRTEMQRQKKKKIKNMEMNIQEIWVNYKM